MKKISVYIVLVFLALSVKAHAEEQHFLTVDELISHGYVQLEGQKIIEIMNNRKIKVIDIETDTVSISRHDEADGGMERSFEETKSDSSSYLLDSRLLARAPSLKGKIDRKVVGDELVSTDGIRTYRYRLFEKQGRVFAVRDIDHGNVFFEVKIN